MPVKIRPLRSTTPSATPAWGSTDDYGELAVNIADKKIFIADATGAVVDLTPVGAGGGDASDWTHHSANFNAAVGTKYLADGGLVVNLPTGPTDGQWVRVADPGDTYTLNSVTINGNGRNINGLPSVTMFIDGSDATFVFNTTANEWGQVDSAETRVPYVAWLAQNANMNDLVLSGFWRTQLGTTNLPLGANPDSLVTVCRGAQYITQQVVDPTSNRLWYRSGSPPEVSGAGSWSNWAEVGTVQGTHNTTPLWSGSATTGTLTLSQAYTNFDALYLEVAGNLSGNVSQLIPVGAIVAGTSQYSFVTKISGDSNSGVSLLVDNATTLSVAAASGASFVSAIGVNF